MSQTVGAKNVLLLAAILAAAVAHPGSADTVPSAGLPAWRVGGYLGVANNSPDGDSWGVIPDRDHYFVGLTGSAPVLRWWRVTLAYAPEVVPALIITKNPKYTTAVRPVNGRPTRVQVEQGSGSVYGAGFSPFGLELSTRVSPSWNLYASSAIGALWFTREVPIANSRDFNYTWELGGGLLWEYRPGRFIRAGYMFHHLSNLDSRPENPGLDGNVIHLGWQYTFTPRDRSGS